MIEQANQMGIVCRDLDSLSKRVTVSGIELVSPKMAKRMGYKYEPFGIVRPTDRREATEEELLRIAATKGTLYKMQLLEFPAALAQNGIKVYEARKGQPHPDPKVFDQLIPGVDGVYLETRYDKSGLVTTSVDTRFTNDDGVPLHNGLHFDMWPLSYGVKYLVVNAGSGELDEVNKLDELRTRTHILAPGITREVLGDPSPKTTRLKLAAYVEQGLRDGTLGTDAAVVYHIEMYGPKKNSSGEILIEGVAGSPVANVLHDGNTEYSLYDSVAVMASVAEIPIGVFPSLI